MGAPGRRREGAWPWRLVLLGLVVFGLAVIASRRSNAVDLIGREDQALGRVRALVRLEGEHRTRAGRFGWLDEVLAEGASGLAPAGTTSWVVDGYRLDVLLPTGRSAGGEVLLGGRGEAQADPLLATLHVAVVARPVRPGVDGLRSFYSDETGTIYVIEGVADAAGREANALPRVRLTQPGDLRSAGPAWRLLDDLERNPERLPRTGRKPPR